MLEQYIGPTVFRDGVRDYLRAHAYGNADTKDLWVSLGKIAKQPVPELMNGWIFQPGYPLITAELREGAELRFNSTALHISAQPLTPHPYPSPVTWQIPLQMRITAGGKAKTSRLLLTEKNTTVPLPHDWESVLINVEGHGFYRVHYAPDLLDRILNTGSDRLAVTERFNLINDAWATTVAGLMPLTDDL